jgi:nitrate reductase delta subunit
MTARMVDSPRLPRLERAACTPDQLRTAHMIVSVLLDYPGERYDEALAAAAESAAGLPGFVRDDVLAFVAWARSTGARAVAEHYVDTFDQRRRCALYLSYYAVGDTRQRGVAILGFKAVVRALGFELKRDELADYLPLVLELSGRTGDRVVLELLASHRDGIEVMRSALRGYRSPYAHLLDALCRTLPPIDEQTSERYQRLVTQGPPAEMVGVGTSLPFPVAGRSAQP